MQKRKILFICESNSARSQMAEAILRKRAGDRYEVFSAGFIPRLIHPLTYEIMADAGCDLKGQYSKDIVDVLKLKPFDTIIILHDPNQREKPAQWPKAPERQIWAVPDPFLFFGDTALRRAKFHETYALIERQITAWLRLQEEKGAHPAGHCLPGAPATRQAPAWPTAFACLEECAY